MRLAKVSSSVAALLALAACSPTVVVKTVCPPLVAYDQPFQTRLADEIDTLQDTSALKKAVVDYHQLRNVIRACEGKP